MHRKIRFLATAASAVVLASALAACGGAPAENQSAGGSATALSVKMSDLKFEPGDLTAVAGRPVRLIATNGGALPHDLTIKGLDKPMQLLVQPGKSGDLEFMPSKAGTYEFACSQPGHAEAGMVGKLVVKSAA